MMLQVHGERNGLRKEYCPSIPIASLFALRVLDDRRVVADFSTQQQRDP
jgi:hypothetical protein